MAEMSNNEPPERDRASQTGKGSCLSHLTAAALCRAGLETPFSPDPRSDAGYPLPNIRAAGFSESVREGFFQGNVFAGPPVMLFEPDTQRDAHVISSRPESIGTASLTRVSFRPALAVGRCPADRCAALRGQLFCSV